MPSNWTPVVTQADAVQLMDQFGGFHDGCLHELHLWTGYSVSPDFTMTCPYPSNIGVRALIQRQLDGVSAIEMFFTGVTRLNIVYRENSDNIIDGATLLVRDGQVYWSAQEDWSPDSPNAADFTFVAAKSLAWRDASQWMGESFRLGLGPPTDAA